MKCNHCGAEISEDSKFCSVCGQQILIPGSVFCPSCGSLGGVDQCFCHKCGFQFKKDFSPPGHPAPSPLPPGQDEKEVFRRKNGEGIALCPAGVGLRCVEGLIDIVILLILGYFFSLAAGQTTEEGFELHGAPAFLWWFAGFFYYGLFESKLGATPGKMALGLRVVKTDGSPCDSRAAIVRTVCRIVDHFLFIGVIIMLFSKRNQRLGDRLADTLVVTIKAMKFQQMKNSQFSNLDD